MFSYYGSKWFIDPPYQYGGKHYPKNQLDYSLLATWCQTRIGQVIVCENDKAKWLKFKPLATMQGQLHVSKESIWTNDRFR